MPFVIRVKTDNAGGTSLDTQFTIPSAASSTSYDYSVSAVAVSPTVGTLVGDPVTHAVNNTALTLDFTAAGTYELTITGTFRGMRFNNGGDKTKLIEIKEWGQWEHFSTAGNGGIFYGCSNLVITATDAPQSLFSLFEFFRGCKSLTDVPNFGSWPTVSSATGFRSIFSGCNSFVGSLSNINDLNVSAATSLASILIGCSSFNQDISGWDVRNVTAWAAAFGSTTANNVEFSTENYNKILSEWSKLPLQPNISVLFLECTYDIGGSAEQGRFYMMTPVLAQACTFDNTTNTVTSLTHGLAADDVVTFTTTGTLPPELAINTRYWVSGTVTADTFQLSTTKGGGAIALTGDGTATTTVNGGYNWTITDAGDTGVQQPSEVPQYIFRNSTPILDGDNLAVQNAKVVIMRYDIIEALTAGEVNQANIVVGTALTDVSGNFSVNVTDFANFDSLQDYIGICYKDGTPILTYIPVKITPISEEDLGV